MEFEMDIEDTRSSRLSSGVQYSDDENMDENGEQEFGDEFQKEFLLAKVKRRNEKEVVVVRKGLDDDDEEGREEVEEEKTEELTPPENFSPVIGEIYRSSFPRPENFPFLASLKLKSILILIPEEYPQENLEFVSKNNIKIFQVGMSGNKEPFVNVPHDVITKALEIAINPQNHPLLIHCNAGKHRTGCLVGCIRRIQNWSLTMIFDEYRRFAAPKARPLDQQFIEMYNEEEIINRATQMGWLPLKW